MTSDTHTIRGMILAPQNNPGQWTLHKDALLSFDDSGKILSLEPTPSNSTIPETKPGCVWCPGFVDTHIHFPQTAIVGSASGELLPWLQRSVFPEESKFVDVTYAKTIAERFCTSLLQNGTTCASIFSSSHPGATDALFETMRRRGLRGDVGLTLMNRGAPDVLLRDTDEAIDAMTELVEKWHGVDNDRLRFRVTPRFALSCTEDLLRAAGDFAQKHNLPIQTHISENPDEITATAQAFPKSQDYLGVYEDMGLVNDLSLFAHGVWLKTREWDAIAQAQSAISHCPDSNFFLRSGAMPLKEAKQRNIKIGLGTDVGAGRSFSLRRCCSRAYDASYFSESTTDAQELLWLATRGGAVAMARAERIGLLEQGFDADLVAIELPEPTTELDSICEQLIFREDHQGVQQVRIRGNIVWSAQPL